MMMSANSSCDSSSESSSDEYEQELIEQFERTTTTISKDRISLAHETTHSIVDQVKNDPFFEVFLHIFTSDY
jgi:hypothetical protein